MSNVRRNIERNIDSMPDEFSTADIPRAEEGGFHSDLGESVGSSPNAEAGRILSRYRDELDIELVERDKPVKDDDGHWTHTAVWQKRRQRYFAVALSSAATPAL